MFRYPNFEEIKRPINLTMYKFVKKVRQKYHCSKKVAVIALRNACMYYLSMEDLEKFIIKQKKRDVTTKIKHYIVALTGLR